MRVRLEVDGRPLEAEVEIADLLLDTLRGHRVTSVKEGCGAGVCGLCAVLVDGLPVSSCLRLAATCDGTRITTAAGVAAGRPRLLQAFAEAEALGCGICSPGQLVMAAAALDRGVATEAEVREALAGSLCRCTGYASIVEAVLSAGGA